MPGPAAGYHVPTRADGPAGGGSGVGRGAGAAARARGGGHRGRARGPGIAQPDGRIIPFESFNLLYRDGLSKILEARRKEQVDMYKPAENSVGQL